MTFRGHRHKGTQKLNTKIEIPFPSHTSYLITSKSSMRVHTISDSFNIALIL